MGEGDEVLRAVIAGAVPAARRGTVWNAPNFAIGGQDMITLNLPPKGPVRVIFHVGSRRWIPRPARDWWLITVGRLSGGRA